VREQSVRPPTGTQHLIQYLHAVRMAPYVSHAANGGLCVLLVLGNIVNIVRRTIQLIIWLPCLSHCCSDCLEQSPSSCPLLYYSHNTFKITSVSILFFHCLVTHPSASDSFATLALYKFIYLLNMYCLAASHGPLSLSCSSSNCLSNHCQKSASSFSPLHLTSFLAPTCLPAWSTILRYELLR